MNVSANRHVVLQAFREVPQEVVFKSDTSTKDQKKINRYWFKFPEQWANQKDKDSIIGIRDMYIAKTNRNISFTISFIFKDRNTKEIPAIYKIFYHTWLDSDDTIGKICKMLKDRSEGILYDYIRNSDVSEWVDPNEDEWNLIRTLTADYQYNDTDQPILLIASLRDNYYYIDDEGNEHDFDVFLNYTTDDIDTKTILGECDYDSTRIVLHPPWTRGQCYVTSSISNDAEDNFLGHTRNDPYIPLKYFRLNSTNKDFWIELYDTRNHNCDVSLPDDNKDILFIEAIVCFTPQGML